MNVQEKISELTDHIRGMWRFRWHAVGISWLVALAAWYFFQTMPNVYVASARVSVDTNSLLPSLTQGLTASENILSEVDLVSKALLTRPNLESVARETDLDLRAKTPQEMELLITGLQDRVQVAGGRDKIFSITFNDTSREMARDVVASLLNTFVESSLGAQGDDADMTERALALEIDDHEQRLLQAEADLAEFKKRNIGFMPDDGADYYTRLQTALSSVSETDRQIRMMRQRRDAIARQLEGEELVVGLMPAQTAAACSQAGNIAELNGQLSAMLVDFTDKHPRIVMLQETITNLEKRCAAERVSMPNTPVYDSAGQPLDANPVYQSLRLQFSNAEVELAALQEQHTSSKRQVATLRANVDKIAEVETQLKRLNRDYGVVEGRHQELLRRWETLQSKKRLDPVTDQVQFNILEPPFAAEQPVAPNRPLLMIVGLVFALGAGVVIAFGLNQLKPVFFTRRSVVRAAGLPVLGSVSMIMSPGKINRNRRMTFVWAGANMGLVALAVIIVVYQERVAALARALIAGVGV